MRFIGVRRAFAEPGFVQIGPGAGSEGGFGRFEDTRGKRRMANDAPVQRRGGCRTAISTEHRFWDGRSEINPTAPA